MSNINKSFTIALISALIVGLPILLIELQLSSLQILIAIFIVSLGSSFASASSSKNRTKQVQNDNRVLVNKAQRESGSVKWFNASKGFGFITRDSGDDIFVHFRSIRGEGHRILHDGQRVEFAISEGDKGLQAEDVAAAK
jgi:CspA family cold shock protein